MSLVRATHKWMAARLRTLGGSPTHPRWSERAQVCAACPLRLVRGGQIYCGRPAWERPYREAGEGCGCPATAKAKDPAEHCPLNENHRPLEAGEGPCACKWCRALATSG